MNHQTKKSGFGRRVLWAGLLVGTSPFAWAQTTDITPLSPAQSLSCLERPEQRPSFPMKNPHDQSFGFMRVQLHFTSPNSSPRVEILQNTAREDMQNRVYRYLRGYRLPCLRPEDGEVRAVQEFRFDNTGRDPLPFPDDDKSGNEQCLVRPRRDIKPGFMSGDKPFHTVIAAAFTGDGSAPPETKVLYSNAPEDLVESAKAWMQEFRMPCRKAGQAPRVVQQAFIMVPAYAKRRVFKRPQLTLMEFLGLTQDVETLEADFDFTTMNCPFKVNYTLYGPHLPNEVSAGKPIDPNRVLFLKWLAERNLALNDERAARDLFGEVLQIQVPCGQLHLTPSSSTSQTTQESSQ
ncbi:hypothetical protein LZ017_08450 [Pelomonas sp. CA6]|uniref:hypothetical protein n=1 Tax=Pelomonas sp. CA6 TaxID=2907999 RepID=UPI001F4C38C1|nr:hypothetical protein [Pelomonas sp. CA6]MCH7343408.1 hypothetical protein [Pelomonas sp. CA6]